MLALLRHADRCCQCLFMGKTGIDRCIGKPTPMTHNGHHMVIITARVSEQLFGGVLLSYGLNLSCVIDDGWRVADVS
jgi:hypothetical protein